MPEDFRSKGEERINATSSPKKKRVNAISSIYLVMINKCVEINRKFICISMDRNPLKDLMNPISQS